MNDKMITVKLWVEKADHDLGTAELTHQHIPEYKDTIAFHCQQAVEKYLKAYLVFCDLKFTRTHDLVLLLSLISKIETVSDELFEMAAELQDYAIEVRYPDTIIELTDDDILRTIEIATNFRRIMLQKMSIESNQD